MNEQEEALELVREYRLLRALMWKERDLWMDQDDFGARVDIMHAHQERLRGILRRLWALRECGEAEVWYVLGCAFDFDLPAAKSPEKALYWLDRAAKAGHLEAMGRLAGRLRQYGRENEAGVLWREAAEKGDAGSMVQLGLFHLYDEGPGYDPAVSESWFLRAYAKGHRLAPYYLGKVNLFELKRHEEALKWFRLAAERKDPVAYCYLAEMLDDRESPVFNPREAVYWWQEVLETKPSSRWRAWMALFKHYRNGIGVEKDLEEAKRCLLEIIEVVPRKDRVSKLARKLLVEVDGDLL